MTDELWEKFFATGRIADYIEYKRREREAGDSFGNSKRCDNS